MGVGDVVQGLGLFGIIKCIMGGAIFAIIGMILLIWGINTKPAVHAKITKLGTKCVKKVIQDKDKDGKATSTHIEYYCNPDESGDWEVEYNDIPYKVIGSWTSSQNYALGSLLPVTLGEDHTAEKSPEAKGIMIGFGFVLLTIGVGMGAFCFWCKDQGWCKTAMGIQEGVGMARSFIPQQKRNYP